MNFLFPTFLIGLAAIAIPIIIHLFNFRKYKKVYFTNVQFLKELKQESDSKSKLKEWLILAMRILAIACLVFTFSQPFIPGKTKAVQGEKAISIYIDNSFSMESTNKKGTLLENAKQHATEIVNTFNASDKFQLLTNDFEGRHQRFVSKEEFIEQINDVKISSATKSINDVIKRQQDFLQNSSSKNKRIFLLSDFQKNTSAISKIDVDTSITISCIPIVSSEINNVYIDSVWFETPVQQYETQQVVHAIVINKSNKDIENGSLKLYINEAQVSLASFNASAGNKKDVSISFTVKAKGINKGVLKIEDYPITYDDHFYFSFNAQTSINALVINGKDTKTSGNFRSLMQNDSLFVYRENSESSIDYNLFANTNIIILNELGSLTSGLTSELQKFIGNGGSVVVFPDKKADLASYNTAFQVMQLPQITKFDTINTKTQSINFEQGLYEGVFDKLDQRMDLPKVFEHFEFTKTTNNNSQNIVLLQNGQFLLSLNATGNGKVYLFSIASDETSSNLLKHALFVPTIIKMAILSLKPSPVYYKTAVNEAIVLSSTTNFSDKPLHIVKDDALATSTNSISPTAKKVDVIPEHRLLNNATTLFTQNQITEAGQYGVFENGQLIKDLAFNFDRKESDMNFMSNEDLQKQIDEKGLKNISIIVPDEKTLTNALQEVNDGKKLWKLFLILALVFLAAEILIIRLFK
ncbi:MAG: BatA and WFA domain-containing protein [Bacteroidota bacterium]